MWQAVFDAIDREQEEAIEQGKVMLDGLEKDARDAAAAARQLGLTFSSSQFAAIVARELNSKAGGRLTAAQIERIEERVWTAYTAIGKLAGLLPVRIDTPNWVRLERSIDFGLACKATVDKSGRRCV